MIFNPQPKPEKKDKQKKELVCKCGSRQVVNKTHILCDDCNQTRLKGEGWKEAKIKHSKELLSKKIQNYSKLEKASKKPLRTASKKQDQINSELSRVYALIDQSREPQCESCGKWHTSAPLSHSHTISVARCKQIGRPDLITDENNIILECFEAPSSHPKACHNIWESGAIEQKRKLLTFEEKMAFIKENDTETHKKFLFQINKL